MLTGGRFRPGATTIAIDEIEGKRVAITVPRGSVIKVVSGPKYEDDRMVDVHWEGRVIVMFESDVNVRGTEIEPETSSAAGFE